MDQHSENKETAKAIDHLFRQEAGKMVAVLTRILGFPNIEQAEDIVQDTILKALEIWKYGKMPEHPEAWLYRTAKNQAIDLIRRKKIRHRIENDLTYLLKSEYTLVPTIEDMFGENSIKDSQLRMMFACCHPSITQEQQITLILKTLCGLSPKEIGNAFLSNEETIRKRIYRTREKIAEERIPLEFPSEGLLGERLESILRTLYLLFNEGYNSSHPERLIREDLCEEAMRLTILLTEQQQTSLPQTYALLALMCYQTSRFNTRLDDKGLIILLQDQDRGRWNQFLISKGNEYLQLSTSGPAIHDFHLEAGIASMHANAGSYENTDWKLILGLYDELFLRTQSPVVALNRALVIGEVEGYEKAIRQLEAMKGLEENCYYHSSLGEMYRKTGEKEKAKKHFGSALCFTSSNAETELIRRKLQDCL
jgi:RNA polymerase sigma factor (sigma-70 family)